ncbi:hypothetical protein F2Q69_00042517 [Brassica cretica]|uniref:Uncharacterized protein n=1 Tax=Brassica cretica TaxID=69181 RepID=A0A8S9NF05_BRACR|nr:hypothetical protein F2Q69_00042517 [Brassica cretica]
MGGGSYPWEPLHHGLHGVEPLGKHLVKMSDHRILLYRCSVRCFLIGFQLRFAIIRVVGPSLFTYWCAFSRPRRWEICIRPGFGCLRSGHGANPSPESTLFVAGRVEGLVLVSESKILRFKLAELLGALLQLLGVFFEFLFQALELRGELGIGLLLSFMQLGYLALQTIDLPLEFGLSLGSFGTMDKAGYCIDFVLNSSRPQEGHRPLDLRWKESRFPGSPLEGTPVPHCGVFRVRSHDRPPSSGKWKTSDKENLPYFRIWKSLTYSYRLGPALGRLYKGNPNPKTRDRHFKAQRLELDG